MTGSQGFTVETGVDKLMSFLKGKGLVMLDDVAKELEVDIKTAELWASFLSEEKLVHLEYKLTKPYISLMSEKDSDGSNSSIEKIKQQFDEENASSNHEFKEYKWKNQAEAVLEKKKNFFMKEASKRELENPEALWQEYKKKVLSQ